MAWETGKQKLHREYKDINKLILEKEGYLEEAEAKILLYKFFRENPSFACELLTGVKFLIKVFRYVSSRSLFDSLK